MSLRTRLEETHPCLPKLAQQLEAGAVSRREFLRTATLLGLASASAYAVAGLPDGAVVRPARAAAGGTVRFSMRVQPIESPATYSWLQDSNISRNVVEYLTRTGPDNVTRGWLCKSWDASRDLRSWTLHLRDDVKWSNGDALVADHVIWNMRRWLDPAVGSSVVGLMKGYMLNDAGDALWDANAIEKVDDHTVRLNARAPQLAVPEHLFHYPAAILHPSENGKFGVGSIGTGAFSLTDYALGKQAVVTRRDGYWGKPAALDSVVFVDNGDDPAVALAAVASGAVHGMYEASTSQYAALQKIDSVQMYQVATGQTAVARMVVTDALWRDARIRKAMKLAIDAETALQMSYLGLGMPGEHHHVSPVHPEYFKLDLMKQNLEEAKSLLAAAGKPDGFEAEIFCKKDPDWEATAVQIMAQMWKQIGVNVKVTAVSFDEYRDLWDKESTGFAFTAWAHRPLGVMVLGLAYRTGAPWNESRYSNPRFDALLTQAEGLLDVGQRRAVMKDIEALLQDEGPIVQPLWRSLFTVMDKRVKGFRMHPTQYIFCEEWSWEA